MNKQSRSDIGAGLVSIDEAVRFLSACDSKDTYDRLFSRVEEAALGGSREALMAMADIYEFGNGFTDLDEDALVEILERGCKTHRIPECAERLASSFRWDDKKATQVVEWLNIGESLLDAKCCAMLAEGYRYEWFGLPDDIELAEKYFRKAVDYGDIESYFELFKVIKSDDSRLNESRSLLRDGAKLGNADCMRELGIALIKGTLFSRNAEEGLVWLRKAGDGEDRVALVQLARIYLRGLAVQRDEVEAFSLLERAANAHSKVAQFELAWLLLMGLGAERSVTQAFAWLKISLMNDRMERDSAMPKDLEFLVESMRLTLSRAQEIAADRRVEAFVGTSSLYKKR